MLKVKDLYDFKSLKEDEEKVRYGYRGSEEDFGKTGRTFKLYVKGLDELEKEGLAEINFKTPKNRKLMKFILMASKLGALRDSYNNDLSLFDALLDFLVENYEVPPTYLDRADPEELFPIIVFGAMISASPS